MPDLVDAVPFSIADRVTRAWQTPPRRPGSARPLRRAQCRGGGIGGGGVCRETRRPQAGCWNVRSRGQSPGHELGL